MEGYFERVVEVLTGAGYRWYETANFCLRQERAGGRDLRARHNLGYWQGRDYLGLGVGAVSTIEGLRWRNDAVASAAMQRRSSAGRRPRGSSSRSTDVQMRERLLLGLRLDEPLPLDGLESAVDRRRLERLARLGLAELRHARMASCWRSRAAAASWAAV